MQVISGKMGRSKVHFESPSSKKILEEIKVFLEWFNSKNKMDGLLRAAIAHFWFVTIHPFEDGNGHVARAITDLALAQDEKSKKRCYSLSVQISHDRAEYYNILERTQKGDLDITNWILWFLETFVRAINRSAEIIERAVLVGNFWKVHAQQDLNPRQKKSCKKCWIANHKVFLVE